MNVNTVRKRRKSLVRFLASCIPDFLWDYFIPVPPRMLICFDLISKKSTAKQNNFPSDDSNTSFCSFKQNFYKRNQQHILNSTPKSVEDIENDKLKELQEQLDEIKKIVVKLMEKQSEQCSGYETLSSPSDKLQKSFIPYNIPAPSSPSPPRHPLPPPPPPPPPPLPPPNFTLLPVNSPLKIEKKKNITTQYGFPCGKELLRDLKKVKLKKIEKSPGGGPLKKPQKVVNDSVDFLAAALKKRFGRIQNSPDSSLESDPVEAENSFGSETIDNSYELEKNNKIKIV